MKVQNIRKKLKLSFVVALTLAFLAFSNADLLFAAAPTVTTGAASSITKTGATLAGAVQDADGQVITVSGFEYGTTTSYGNTNSGTTSYQETLSFTTATGDFGGVDVDSSGNIYVGSCATVRKYDSSGNLLLTIGGGTCTFGGGGGAAVDSSGNVYATEYDLFFFPAGDTIKKYNSAGVYQSSIASFTGGVDIDQSVFPRGLETDSSGNLFVADGGLLRIQKFNSAGVPQFVAGWSVDTAANVFEVCTITCEQGLAGSGNGQFGQTALGGPWGIAVDSSGTIYATDTDNDRIQKFNSSGVWIPTNIGSSGSGNDNLDGPTDLDIDSYGNIYVTDTGNDRVQKFDSSGVFVESITGVLAGADLSGIAVDEEQNVYFTNRTGTDTLKKYSRVISASAITGLTCGTTYHYRAFATNADGTSYGSDATFTTSACDTPTVSTDATSNIARTTATLNGTHLTQGVDASTLRGFQYGPTTSYGSTVSSAGSLSVVAFGSSGSAEGEFGSPYGITLDSSENIYVSDTDNNRIQKFDSDGVFMTMLGWGVAGGGSLETCTTGCTAGSNGSGNGELNAPRGLAVDINGNIFVADYGNDRVQKFNSSGAFLNKVSILAASIGQLNGPSDVDFRPSANGGYVADTGNSRVIQCLSFPSCGGDYAHTGLNAPEGIDTSFRLLIADTGDNQLAMFDAPEAAKIVSLSYAVDIGGLLSPKGIVSTSDGTNVYVSDSGHDRILRFTSDNPTATPYNLKFISQFGASGSAVGQFSGPSHIAMNSDNEIYVADTGNHRIQKLSPFFSEDISSLNCGTTYHYRAFATNSDGTGYGSDQTFTTSNCGSTSGSGGGPIYGCTDSVANNYNSNADIDNNTCDYTGLVSGCIDSDATNYNPLAVLSDMSCNYPTGYYGCTDPLANNYNASALVDDGSCNYGPPVPGCTNPLANNYNPLATVDDGSCDNDTVGPPDDDLGCTDTFADNFDPTATVDDGLCHYSQPTSSYGCIDHNALNFDPNATTSNGICTYPPPDEPPIITTIVKIIENITGLDREDQIDVYKGTAVAGLVVPSIFLLLAERSAIASVILRLWNIIPTLLGFRRKRRPWGTVFDSVTKQPLDPVYVTLRDVAGAEVATSITDLDGRYGFITEAGEYKLDAKKTDYIFPSKKMKGEVSDELYNNLYFGENIKVLNETEIINKNIPMDAIKFNWNEFTKTKNRKLMKFFSKTELFLARIAKIIFIAGFAASFLLIFLEPTTWNYIILAVYVTILTLSFIGVRPRKPGFIIERATGYPMSFAIITVFSAMLDREVAHTIVGKTGKYHILVPKGKYYMKLQKKTGEQTYEEVYTSDVFRARNGYIDRVIKI